MNLTYSIYFRRKGIGESTDRKSSTCNSSPPSSVQSPASNSQADLERCSTSTSAQSPQHDSRSPCYPSSPSHSPASSPVVEYAAVSVRSSSNKRKKSAHTQVRILTEWHRLPTSSYIFMRPRNMCLTSLAFLLG